MPKYDDKDRGVLFKVQDKKTEKAPDFSGKINIGGTETELVGWTGTSGEHKYIQLRVAKAKPEEGG